MAYQARRLETCAALVARQEAQSHAYLGNEVPNLDFSNALISVFDHKRLQLTEWKSWKTTSRQANQFVLDAKTST